MSAQPPRRGGKGRRSRHAPAGAAIACGAALASFAFVPWVAALWSDGAPVEVPPLPVGGVQFAASALAPSSTFEYSEGGEPVTVTMPGSEILRILDAPPVPGDPRGLVIWQFKIAGGAHGIAGIEYDVEVPAPDDHTLRSMSVTTVYPAGVGGDCSLVPSEQPVLSDLTFQRAGSNPTGESLEQIWCVAVDWLEEPDGLYRNAAHATAAAMDGRRIAALAMWQSSVSFPPSPRGLGTYENAASVQALAADGTTAEADTGWRASVVADPSGEPALTLTITPRVTSLANETGEP